MELRPVELNPLEVNPLEEYPLDVIRPELRPLAVVRPELKGLTLLVVMKPELRPEEVRPVELMPGERLGGGSGPVYQGHGWQKVKANMCGKQGRGAVLCAWPDAGTYRWR